MLKIKCSIALLFVVILLCSTLCSCGQTLNAEYKTENGHMSFYGTNFDYIHYVYDRVFDTYNARVYSGTYLIYPDPDNSERLLIALYFSDNNIDPRVYAYESGINENGKEIIMINGKEFVKTLEHEPGYGFTKFLYDLGIIK